MFILIKFCLNSICFVSDLLQFNFHFFALNLAEILHFLLHNNLCSVSTIFVYFPFSFCSALYSLVLLHQFSFNFVYFESDLFKFHLFCFRMASIKFQFPIQSSFSFSSNSTKFVRFQFSFSSVLASSFISVFILFILIQFFFKLYMFCFRIVFIFLTLAEILYILFHYNLC